MRGLAVAIPVLATLSPTLLAAQPSSAPQSAPAAAATDAREFLIEAPVASVNQSILTLGQVEAEARLVLLRRGGLAGADRAVDDGLRAAVLAYMINQEVILAEARRLQLFQVPEPEVHDEVLRLESLFGGREPYLSFLSQQGLSEEDVADIVRRDLRVARFLKSRVQMMARLPPAELQAYYKQHAEEYPERSFEQARPAIEEKLGRERHDQAIRAWVDELKARAEIRVLRSFEAGTPP